jgi:hypothetical protein
MAAQDSTRTRAGTRASLLDRTIPAEAGKGCYSTPKLDLTWRARQGVSLGCSRVSKRLEML